MTAAREAGEGDTHATLKRLIEGGRAGSERARCVGHARQRVLPQGGFQDAADQLQARRSQINPSVQPGDRQPRRRLSSDGRLRCARCSATSGTWRTIRRMRGSATSSASCTSISGSWTKAESRVPAVAVDDTRVASARNALGRDRDQTRRSAERRGADPRRDRAEARRAARAFQPRADRRAARRRCRPRFRMYQQRDRDAGEVIQGGVQSRPALRTARQCRRRRKLRSGSRSRSTRGSPRAISIWPSSISIRIASSTKRSSWRGAGSRSAPKSEFAPLGHYVLADIYSRQGHACRVPARSVSRTGVGSRDEIPARWGLIKIVRKKRDLSMLLVTISRRARRVQSAPRRRC